MGQVSAREAEHIQHHMSIAVLLEILKILSWLTLTSIGQAINPLDDSTGQRMESN